MNEEIPPARQGERFVCEWCGHARDMAEHLLVPCPNMDDEHSVCLACILAFASADYRRHLATVGDASVARRRVTLGVGGSVPSGDKPKLTHGEQLSLEGTT